MDFKILEQKLFRFSKIIEVRQDGQLKLIPENLNGILSCWQNYSSAPARFLAVTGGNKSRNTLVTNLLIQRLLNSTGTEKQVEVQGFSWDSNSKKLTSLVHCDDRGEADGGAVYLWPNLFLSTGNENGGAAVDKDVLWILHIDAGSNPKNELDFQPIEQFLLLICSHLVEILYSSNKFQLVSSTDTLLKEGVEINELCQSITYLVRAPEGSLFDSSIPTINIDEETTRQEPGNLFEISEFSKTPENRVKFKKESINHFQNATILKFPNNLENMYGRNGFLFPDALNMVQPYLVNIISDVVKTPPKMVLTGGIFQALTGKNTTEFFIRAVNIINYINSVPMEVVNEEENLNETEQQQYLNQNHPLAENNTEVWESVRGKKQDELKPFMSHLQTLILKKIESCLKFSNVSSLFQDCFQEASMMPHADDPIPQDLMEKYRLEIEKLSFIAKGFSTTIRRYFTTNYVCFLNNKDLEKFCQRECTDFLKAYNVTSTHSNYLPLEKLASKACEKLGIIFHEENAEIVINELNMGDKVVNKLWEFYKSEMLRFLTETGDNILSYTRKELEDDHRKLEKECISLFRECMNFNGKRNDVLPMKEEELKNYLTCGFEEHAQLVRREQFNAQQAVTEKQFQNKASYSQVVSRGLPNSSIGRPVPLRPVKVHPQNQFMDATLIFQLSLDDVTMGCIHNKEGNGRVPSILETDLTLVARDDQHQYLFGSDVFNIPGKRLWSLRNLLVDEEHQNQQHKNQKVLEEVVVTKSYLLGMLLRKLRGKAESQAGQKFSQAIVTLPRHMKQLCHQVSMDILEGAKIYGEFENVEILKENDCLALAFLNSIDKSQFRNRRLLVLSQNSQFVEICLHYFDENLEVRERVVKIVAKSEKTILEKIMRSRKTIDDCLKIAHSMQKHDKLVTAAVVGSGALNPETYVGKLVNYFSPVYFFEDSYRAVIIGAVLAVSNRKHIVSQGNENVKMSRKREQANSARSSKSGDDAMNKILQKGVLNAPVQQGSTSRSNREHVSPSVSVESEQKKEKVEISQELQKGKQLLIDICNKIESRIEQVQFQSELAKKVLLKKVTEGRKVALECGSRDSKDDVKLVEIQIDALQELGVRNKLFA